MIRIEPIDGEAFRFHAHSENSKDVYLVDLEEHGVETGACTCPHFTCRLAPRINLGESGRLVRCKHITAAREVWTNMVAQRIADRLNEK